MFHMSFHKTRVKLALHHYAHYIPQLDKNPIFHSYQYLEITKEAPEYNLDYSFHIYQFSSGYHHPLLICTTSMHRLFSFKKQTASPFLQARIQLFDTSEPFLVFFNHCLQYTCLLSYMHNITSTINRRKQLHHLKHLYLIVWLVS